MTDTIKEFDQRINKIREETFGATEKKIAQMTAELDKEASESINGALDSFLADLYRNAEEMLNKKNNN